MDKPDSSSPVSELEIEERIQSIRNEAEELSAILKKQYSEDDPRTVRAIEVCNCLQRLRWDLDRHAQSESA
jgi:hypothetical protein